MGHIKQIKLMLLMILSLRNEGDFFLEVKVYKLAKALVFANHELIYFFGVDVILCSSLIALLLVQTNSG